MKSEEFAAAIPSEESAAAIPSTVALPAVRISRRTLMPLAWSLMSVAGCTN
ncbi:MAG: hypothetical protein IJ551_04010 [Prevotella sp.]|nr:hypothetical protein [Prevotella sp.]